MVHQHVATRPNLRTAGGVASTDHETGLIAPPYESLRSPAASAGTPADGGMTCGDERHLTTLHRGVVWLRPPGVSVSYRRLNRWARGSSRLKSSCSVASNSCSAALSSAVSLRWAANSNRHHLCSMTEMHTAAATTTTAAADHQYATMTARTGTPTLAMIGCRSAHDCGCMCSR